MNEQNKSLKKEIKINKRKMNVNILNIFLSLFISFIILLSISISGNIRVYDPLSNPRSLIYEGFLSHGHTGGNGNLEEHLKQNFIARSVVQDDSWFSINNNFILGDEHINKLKFKHKFFIFYLPIVIFKSFWLWMLLTLFIFIIIKLKHYLQNKYYIKFK